MFEGDLPMRLSTEAGETKSAPVDLEHLARQTLDDKEVQREVLKMFVDQIAVALSSIEALGEKDRFALAHSLKGSARSVGAFALADCAEQIEQDPQDLSAILGLRLRAAEVCAYIEGLRL